MEEKLVSVLFGASRFELQRLDLPVIGDFVIAVVARSIRCYSVNCYFPLNLSLAYSGCCCLCCDVDPMALAECHALDPYDCYRG